MLLNQYDVIYGSWPNSHDEIVIVVNSNNEIDDMTLYALGLKPKAEMDAIMDSAINGTDLEATENSWTFEEICDMEFRVILNPDCYSYDAMTDTYTDLRDTETGLKYLYEEKGISLKVSGILRVSDDVEQGMLSGTIGYTSKLTEYVINNAKDSLAVNAQLNNTSTDIFTGLPFKENTGTLTSEEKEEYFRNYILELSDAKKAAAYVAMKSIPTEEFIQSSVDAQMANMDRAAIEAMLAQAFAKEAGMSEEEIAKYLGNMSDEDLFGTFAMILREQVKAQYAAQIQQQMAGMQSAQLIGALNMEMETYSTEQCAIYYDEIVEFSDATYEGNLQLLGYLDLDDPSAIHFYASTFENKDVIEETIADYNATVEDIKQITYTDYVGLMMSSITTVINAITYVLIAFVAISLIVSSIMIAVITLISVQERTKEIGILRAMGASKHNVSVMFNAETILIGFASGVLGVGITYLACFPINAVIHYFTKLNNLNAYLPWQVAVVLVAISVTLNLFSGLIPAKSAAKKDPVVALRTE
jgi:putative ABC transport system permease protein